MAVVTIYIDLDGTYDVSEATLSILFLLSFLSLVLLLNVCTCVNYICLCVHTYVCVLALILIATL